MVNDDAKSADSRFQDETVDDILAGILNKDGSFNDEFGALLTKYLGDDAAHVASLRGIDLSDRIDEPRYRQRVEFESPDARAAYGGSERTIDRRIEEKIPENVRYMYSEAAANAQRPEFTSSGSVRYPAMGVGDSEERVVYDAEWEERARQEAARLQRVREDRMLRGDSTYVRSFVAGGRPMRGGAVRSPYIDPLSADEDLDDPYRYAQKKQEDRQSFFQEGPPAAKERNRAGRQHSAGSAGGRTDRRMTYGDQPEEEMFESFSDSYESEQAARAAWLQPDEENAAGKKRRNDRRRSQRPQITSTLRDDYDRMSLLREGEGGRPYRRPPEETETLTRPPHVRRAAEEKAPPPEKKDPPDPEALTRTARETEGLRSTVAEIVDKYNKRSEEEVEARAKELQEKLARQEAERLAREDFLKSLPPELVTALNEANADEAAFGGYDDFSGAQPGAVLPQADSLRAFAQAHAAEASPQENDGAQPEQVPAEGAEEAPAADGEPPQNADQPPEQDYSVYLDPYDEAAEDGEYDDFSAF